MIALLTLSGCFDILFEASEDSGSRPPPPGDTATDTADTDSDTDTDPDPDTEFEVDTGTFVVPGSCATASWTWGVENTIASADATFVGSQPDGAFGRLMAAPGDMDGDGLGDLVITASWEDSNAGVVYFVHGGVRRVVGQSLVSRASLAGSAPEQQFAHAIAIGDVDGDDLADVALYAGGYDPTQYLFRGRTSGWPVRGNPLTITDARVTNSNANGSTDVSSFGPIGDLDGDGVDDWAMYGPVLFDGELHVVSGPDAVGDFLIPDVGTTWIHGDIGNVLWGDLDGDGQTDLLATASDWKESSVILGADAATAWDVSASATAAATVSDARPLNIGIVDDLDGDGSAELAAGILNDSVPSETGMYLFFGGSRWTGALTIADADVHIGAGEWIHSATWLGDLDGDGLPELGVIEDTTHGSAGGTDAYIFLGRVFWPSTLALADADVHITGDSVSGEYFRFPDERMHGDIDGDGIGDLIMRIPDEDATGVDRAGRISVYLGRASWPSELGAADADVTFVGHVDYQSVGESQFTLVEDLDGDGCDDIVSATTHLPETTEEGQVSVLFGQYAP